MKPVAASAGEAFERGIADVREAFSVDDPDRAVIRDALFQMALDAGKPLHAGKAAAYFADETQIPDMFATRLDERSVLALGGQTLGLRVDGKKLSIDRDGILPALSVHARRLRVLAMLRRVIDKPHAVPPGHATDVVERVRDMQRFFADGSGGYPRGPIPNVGPDDRAIALHMLSRVLGRSPRLEAFMAVVAAGGDVAKELVEDALQEMGVKAFRRPSVLKELEEQAALEVEGDSVKIQEDMPLVIGQGIASVRRIIASLHAHVPADAPRMHDRRRGRAASSVRLAEKSGVDPVPGVARHDDMAGIPRPASTERPPGRPTVAVPRSADHEAVMADWHAKRYKIRRRRGSNERTGPRPASVHRRIKQTYGDEGKNGDEPSAAMVTHLGRQQSKPFHLLRDNPALLHAAVDAYMAKNECTVEEAEAAVIAAHDKRVAERMPPETEPVEDRSGWITMPTPPKRTHDGWGESASVPVRPEKFAVDSSMVEAGKEEHAKMQFVLSRCLASANELKKNDFIAAFGPHLYEGAQCSADVCASLDALLRDQYRLAVARTVATYGVHSVAEYVTLKGMGDSAVIEWDSLPLSRMHELHGPYVAALAREIVDRVKRANDFSPSGLRQMIGEIFLGEHFTTRANMSFGSHLLTLIEAGREGDVVDDPEGSKGRSLEQFFAERGDDVGFTPWNTEGWVPTDAPAGSAKKLQVLSERIDAGQHLWHPEDRVDFSNVRFHQLSAAEQANLVEREQELKNREYLDAQEEELRRKKADGAPPAKADGPGRKGQKKAKRLANVRAAS